VGARLSTQSAVSSSPYGWRIDPRMLPAYSSSPVIRAIRGSQSAEWGDRLFTTRFKVTAQSDRMGLRLVGENFPRSSAPDLLSTAVVPGTVQVPPDGQPMVLMADAQTIGGYPQAAHVICVDLPLMAQLRPGDVLRFAEVSIEEAHRLALARDRAMAILREGLAEKLNGVTGAVQT
jgi:antagonist of KipI